MRAGLFSQSRSQLLNASPNTTYHTCLQIHGDLLQAELDHLRRQLALERERSDVLREQLANAEGDLKAATDRLQTRAVLGKESPTTACISIRCSLCAAVACRRSSWTKLKITN